MSHTVDLNTLDASPVFPAPSFGTIGTPDGTPDEPYVIRVVDMTGALITELATTDPLLSVTHPEDIVETLNGYETFAVTFPKSAFTKDQVNLLGTDAGPMEIQVLLGGEVLAWGPAIAEQGGSGAGSVTLQCSGVGWYFAKRFIDEEPTNLLSYGGFEHGDFAGWHTSGSASAGAGGGTIGDNVLAEIETDNVFQGTYAARLTAAFSPTGLGLASNVVTVTAGPRTMRLGLTFSAEIELFLATALYNAGVILIAGPPGGDGRPQGGVNAKSVDVWRLDASTARHVELREELEVKIPANKTWAVQVWVFAPAGIVVYDHFFLAPHKKLDTYGYSGAPSAAIDCARIVRMIFDHTLSDLHHHGKSDLHIGYSTPDCGLRQARQYDFADHIPVDQAIGEFLNRDDCFDLGWVYTPTTRTAVLYPLNAGGQGTDYGTDVVLTYGSAPFSSYTTSLDGGSTATKVVELGDGAGIVREEGWATDEAGIGGTTLQDAVAAPSGSPFNSLEPLARSAVQLRRRPAEVIEVTISREAGGYIPDDTVKLADLLKLGDSLTLDIVDGWHTYAGHWRIVRRTRHCRARTFTYTLNRLPA